MLPALNTRLHKNKIIFEIWDQFAQMWNFDLNQVLNSK